MADRLPLLQDEAVRSAVAGALGIPIEYHATIGSTQDRAAALAPGPHVVIADEQSAGRGTRDRRWLAPKGSSLLASFVLPGPPAGAAVASLIAGVAVAMALDSLEVPGARLKWPNDVQLAGKKVAGILTQISTGPAGHLVVGIGLNVSQDADTLRAIEMPATSLRAEGHERDRLDVLVGLTRELDSAFSADPAAMLAAWRERSNVLGRPVSVKRAGEETVRGEAVDLEADGALLVRTAYGRVRIIVGEVTVEA